MCKCVCYSNTYFTQVILFSPGIREINVTAYPFFFRSAFRWRPTNPDPPPETTLHRDGNKDKYSGPQDHLDLFELRWSLELRGTCSRRVN